MTPIQCAIDLAAFIKQQLAEMNYEPTDDKILANGITVRSGYMPVPKNNEEKAKQCPYILVRPVEVDDTDDPDNECKAHLQILVMTYNGDTDNGHLELYHLLELVRQIILKNRIIVRKYSLQLPAKTFIPEIQPFPQWFGYMTVDYLIPQPEYNIVSHLGR